MEAWLGEKMLPVSVLIILMSRGFERAFCCPCDNHVFPCVLCYGKHCFVLFEVAWSFCFFGFNEWSRRVLCAFERSSCGCRDLWSIIQRISESATALLLHLSPPLIMTSSGGKFRGVLRARLCPGEKLMKKFHEIDLSESAKICEC